MFETLAQYLERSLNEAKFTSMNHLSDVTPVFNLRASIVGFIYHILYYLLLGPLTYFVVWAFSGRIFAENMRFGLIMLRVVPFLTVVQLMSFLLVTCIHCILIYEKMKYGEI